MIVFGMSMLAGAAQAGRVELRAKGSGDNGDGSAFRVSAKYQSNDVRTEALFKFKRAVPGSTHTVCFSTDGCTFSFAATIGESGRGKVKFDSADGTLPPDFPALMAGDELIVDGEAVGTFRRDT